MKVQFKEQTLQSLKNLVNIQNRDIITVKVTF